MARLAQSPNVTAAARAAGIARPYAYQVRDEDPEFAAAWDSAIEEAVDGLEAEAFRRAKKESDPLLMFLLKTRRPVPYRDVPKGATVTNEGDGRFNITLSWGDTPTDG